MPKDTGLLDTSSFGAAPGPGPDNYDRPSRDAMSGRGAPRMPSIGVSVADDGMKGLGSNSASLERYTHPERHQPAASEDSGVEGAEHLGSGAPSESAERE